MPRNLTANVILALEEPYLYPAFFVEVYLASGPVRICTCYQPQILNGITYTGVGSLLQLSTIAEGSDIQARGMTVTLGGIDPILVPAVLNEFQIGLAANIYFGVFGGEGLTLVNSPVVAWSGRTDQATISFPTPDQASITLALESILLDMNTPVPYRYTNIDQQTFHPGDLGMSWVNSIQNIPIYWGQNTNSDGNP